MEVGEVSDIASKDDIATPTPYDPQRGLPQLFRPRGFSSDFSEDGDPSSSRRNSVSEGGVVTVPIQFTMPDVPPSMQEEAKRALIRSSTPGAELPMQEEAGPLGRALIGMVGLSGKVQGAVSAAQMLLDASEEVFVEIKKAQVGRCGKGSSTKEAIMTAATKLVTPTEYRLKRDPVASKQAEPVLPPPPKLRRGAQLPPPLHLISPSADPGLQGRSLSPVSRSPGGRIVRFGLPTLSPLHTPPIRPVLPPPLLARPDLETTPVSPNGAHHALPLHAFSQVPSSHLPQTAPTAPVAVPSLTAAPSSLPPRLPRPTSLLEVSQQQETPVSQNLPTEREEASPKPAPALRSPRMVALKSLSINIRRSRSVSSLSPQSPTSTPEEREGCREGVASPVVSAASGELEAVTQSEPSGATMAVGGVGTEEAVVRCQGSSSSSSPSSLSPSTPPSLYPQLAGGRSPSLSPQGGLNEVVASPPSPEREGEDEQREGQSSPVSSEEEETEGEDFQDETTPPQTTPPEQLLPEAAVITEEVATLDSGVGGARGVVEDSLAGGRDVIISDIVRRGDDEDDIVQTIVSRESPISDDDIIQSSSQSHTRRESPSDGDDVVQSSHTGGVAPPGVSQEVMDVLGQPFSSDDSDAESVESELGEATVGGTLPRSRVTGTLGSRVEEDRSPRGRSGRGVAGSQTPIVVVSKEKVR